ncbi:hypothetical protein L2E82_43674 [Cichorium intybus]|uniref:Uncharacterized protein n=1 Tax=Cichorium intybus TaxID=13427 RepID=A0ACB8ZP66_CICIN|nr:hypothetical protein L2E82_43674 [Cichorium intybus]
MMNEEEDGDDKNKGHGDLREEFEEAAKGGSIKSLALGALDNSFLGHIQLDLMPPMFDFERAKGVGWV